MLWHKVIQHPLTLLPGEGLEDHMAAGTFMLFRPYKQHDWGRGRESFGHAPQECTLDL